MRRAGDGLAGAVLTPRGLSLLTGILLAGHWYGGQGLLLVAGLAIPGLIAAFNLLGGHGTARAAPEADLPGRAALLAALAARIEMQGFAALHLVELDLPGAEGAAVASRSPAVLPRLIRRLSEPGGGRDLLAEVGPNRYALLPADPGNMAGDAALRRAGTLQALLAEPVWLGAAAVRVQFWIGLATTAPSAPGTAGQLLDAAERALEAAMLQGPGAISCTGTRARPCRVDPARLLPEIPEALETGAIRIWFQPQLSTDTGEIAGIEAVPRWLHPFHGTLAADEFVPAIRQSAHVESFCALLLDAGLRAMAGWIRAGASVPSVWLTLPHSEFMDPCLPDRIRWDLDRYELAPARLGLLVSQSLAGDEPALRNLRRLSDMGLRLDLADPEPDLPPLTTLRRLELHRLRIGRQLVNELDGDREARARVAKLVELASRLGLQTLAVGVETPAEHAMLGQLGCGAVQGLGIAPPMPVEEARHWVASNRQRLAALPAAGRRAGGG